jgi:hypothetical protein
MLSIHHDRHNPQCWSPLPSTDDSKWYHNFHYNLIIVPFMATIVIAVLFTTITILFPPSWLASVLELTNMTISFAFLLIAIALGNFIISWISEKIVFVQIQEMVDRFSMWMRKKNWGGHVKIKRYQVVEEGT